MALTTSAHVFIPARMTLKALREMAKQCPGCELYKNTRRTVFGERSRRASMMLCGDEENKQRRPLVGPAGRLLDDAMCAPDRADRDRIRGQFTDDLHHTVQRLDRVKT